MRQEVNAEESLRSGSRESPKCSEYFVLTEQLLVRRRHGCFQWIVSAVAGQRCFRRRSDALSK